MNWEVLYQPLIEGGRIKSRPPREDLGSYGRLVKPRRPISRLMATQSRPPGARVSSSGKSGSFVLYLPKPPMFVKRRPASLLRTYKDRLYCRRPYKGVLTLHYEEVQSWRTRKNP